MLSPCTSPPRMASPLHHHATPNDPAPSASSTPQPCIPSDTIVPHSSTSLSVPMPDPSLSASISSSASSSSRWLDDGYLLTSGPTAVPQLLYQLLPLLYHTPWKASIGLDASHEPLLSTMPSLMRLHARHPNLLPIDEMYVGRDEYYMVTRMLPESIHSAVRYEGRQEQTDAMITAHGWKSMMIWMELSWLVTCFFRYVIICIYRYHPQLIDTEEKKLFIAYQLAHIRTSERVEDTTCYSMTLIIHV